MKIELGTIIITHYKNTIPCDCNKPCPICFLWNNGYGVKRFNLLGIKLLLWSKDWIKK